jgi:EIN3-binding F-box protein
MYLQSWLYWQGLNRRDITQMFCADVKAACMKTQDEVIGAIAGVARCAVRKQVDGMGTLYAQQKFSSLDSIYHGFSLGQGNGEHSPQRAEWIGDDDFGLHTSELPTPYRPAASVFVESLSLKAKRRRTSRETQDDYSSVRVPEVDQVDLVNTLPDECLQEIFGFLPKVQDRCAAASVCMRWLMLQSRMQRIDFKSESTRCKGGCTKKDVCAATKSAAEIVDPAVKESSDVTEDRSDEEQEDEALASSDEVHTCGDEMDVDIDEEPRVQRQPQWALGELSRKFEGRKATDVKLALVAIGELARGGLGTLKVVGGSAHGGKGVTDAGLIAIGNCCAALRSLTLWDCDGITDVGLAAIGNGCRLLEKLDLMKCPGVGDRGLQAVAKGCPLLSAVNIDSCLNVGNASLEAFGKWSGALYSFSVSNCPIVGSAGIGKVTLGCSKLKKLKLEKIRLSDEGLVAIGENCKSVSRMKLANLGWCSEEGFIGLCGGSGLKLLKSLLITSCPGITDVSLEVVGKVCQDLKLCVLSQCQAVTDKGLEAFMQCCVCLDSLQLERCHSITNSGLSAALAQGKGSLKTLYLSRCDGLWKGEKRCEELPLTGLSLKTLKVTDCKSAGVEPIVTMGLCCPSLENLDLSELTNLSDEAITSVVEGCGDHLVSLNLTNCTNITDAAIAAIASHCGDLERLTLDGCYHVGDNGLKMLAAECISLKELDLSETSITDSGLRSLITARGLWLRSLTLTGCVNLTDESLSLIEDCCPSLGALNLRNCPLLSREGLSSLESQLWSCDDFVCS